MEEEREDMSEKVDDEEEEREVITVREALALSISPEYKFTTKYEPQWRSDSQDKCDNFQDLILRRLASRWQIASKH